MEVETHACGHDASEYHVGMALWASRAMDVDADVVRQGIGFLHDASLKEAGAQHSLSPVICPWSSAVIGTTLDFRVLSRSSILISLRSAMRLC